MSWSCIKPEVTSQPHTGSSPIKGANQLMHPKQATCCFYKTHTSGDYDWQTGSKSILRSCVSGLQGCTNIPQRQQNTSHGGRHCHTKRWATLLCRGCESCLNECVCLFVFNAIPASWQEILWLNYIILNAFVKSRWFESKPIQKLSWI